MALLPFGLRLFSTIAISSVYSYNLSKSSIPEEAAGFKLLEQKKIQLTATENSIHRKERPNQRSHRISERSIVERS
jgi:hypothetical protein